MGQREFYDGLKGPAHDEWAAGAQFFAGLKKEAYGVPLSCGPESGPPSWLGQFEGTPLHEQAIALEREELRMQAEDLAKRQQERAQNEGRMQADSARWDLQDQIRLKKRELELQLAETRAGIPREEPTENPGGVPEMLMEQNQSVGMDPAATPMPKVAADLRSMLTARRLIPIATGAAIGGGLMMGANMPIKGKDKSYLQIKSEKDLENQNPDADEGGMGLIQKLKRRATEAGPGIAKALREHPIQATLMAAAAGGKAGNTIGRRLAAAVPKALP